MSSAFAQQNLGYFYTELKGGLLLFPTKNDSIRYKTGFTGSGELCYVYKDFRFSFELIYCQAKSKDYVKTIIDLGDITGVKRESLSGLVNLYYDYSLTDNFNLYAGTGLGLAKTKGKAFLHTGSVLSSDPCTKLAYQLMAGISYNINDCWTIKTGYRFFNIKHKHFPHMHVIEAGIRYNF